MKPQKLGGGGGVGGYFTKYTMEINGVVVNSQPTSLSFFKVGDIPRFSAELMEGYINDGS